MPLHLLFADERGHVYDHPELLALVHDPQAAPEQLGAGLPRDRALPFPPGAALQVLPGRKPVGLDPSTGRAVVLDEVKLGRRKVRPLAVAAVLPPGFTRLAIPAYAKRAVAPVLPQWAYTAAAWDPEHGHVAWALHTDRRTHWDPQTHSTPDLKDKVAALKARFPQNPLYAQLETCALSYRCFTAQNTFYGRDEGAIPASSGCNARCVGCISDQPPEGPPPSHERMDEAPEAEWMAELGAEHLATAPGRTMVSFGQGCEGEPLTRGRELATAIRKMRERTRRGSINLNTNGSLPKQLGWVIDAGLDAVRVSLNSAHAPLYEVYYKPIHYRFEQVVESIHLAKRRGVYTALNLLTFPGVVDQEGEADALCRLVSSARVDQVQVRSLAIDPEAYLAVAHGRSAGGPAIGMERLFQRLRRARKGLVIGNFARGLEERGKGWKRPISPTARQPR
jgi:pyruvate-formate lyase-activating enzyme